MIMTDKILNKLHIASHQSNSLQSQLGINFGPESQTQENLHLGIIAGYIKVTVISLLQDLQVYSLNSVQMLNKLLLLQL